jgi:hypothetical protein
MFASILSKQHDPTFLFLVSDFTFVMMDAMAQRLQRRAMTTAQVVLLRFVSRAHPTTLAVSLGLTCS